MKKAIITAAALALTLSTPAHSRINPWVDCGIGAMVFSGTPAGAAISNVIWDLGTTAVTSAASSQGTCEGGRFRGALFIQQSYDQIIFDTAQGEGEHLNAMLDIMQCDSNIIPAIRSDISTQIQRADYTEMSHIDKSQAYFNVVDTHCDAA